MMEKLLNTKYEYNPSNCSSFSDGHIRTDVIRKSLIRGTENLETDFLQHHIPSLTDCVLGFGGNKNLRIHFIQHY
jgi:hypothetical protein